MVQIGPKKLTLSHFEFFLFISSYTLWVTPQDFVKWKTFLRYISVVSFIIGLFHKKKQTGGGGEGGWGYGISRDIEEIASRISRGQLKTTWYFQGWSKINHVEFPGVLVLGHKISDGCNKIFSSFLWWSFDLFVVSRR